jgi:enamine deaminase RidA (YjgF/YER057c/UK114 family)
MENIGDILKANGLTFDDVFKCTAMLADMSKWGAFNKIYVTYFAGASACPIRAWR